MKTTVRGVEDTIRGTREDWMLLGEDCNCRIGERGTRNSKEKRKSKDNVENTQGKRLMEWIKENGWETLNGNKQKDEEGKWTYRYK
jgi:hypothetical protein